MYPKLLSSHKVPGPQPVSIRFHAATLLIAILLAIEVAPASAAASSPELPGWKLLWQDEFDGPTLDPAKWSLCERGRSDWNDTMSADPRCVVLTNGTLRLLGFLNDSPDTNSTGYLTGGVNSKNKFQFRYGKVVIRARFKCARGAWPALWMLGSQGSWPGNGEIDLMEHLNFDDFVYQTVHSDYTKRIGSTSTPPKSARAKIDRDEFNTYGVEWSTDRLLFLVNDKPVFTYPRISAKGPDQWPFDRPFYFILSMQIGGKWVGKEDPADYPAHMEIDWVRVYQKPSQ